MTGNTAPRTATPFCRLPRWHCVRHYTVDAAGVWSCADWQHRATHSHTFLPTTTDDDRDARYTKWKMAVQRSLGWATTKKSITMTEERYKLLASIPATLYVIGSFTMLVASNILKSS
ncbi:hypothetical protein JYU34_022206 [Plutella xylostella]|uniref:Uncharacterized protein n=1 Tax=Plutella xylostella TaxID=51655 RepID=A0ABQ7PR11_PLUXY|nr:hypothetical protein JYU34_022206 [Plutella xylostella]